MKPGSQASGCLRATEFFVRFQNSESLSKGRRVSNLNWIQIQLKTNRTKRPGARVSQYRSRLPVLSKLFHALNAKSQVGFILVVRAAAKRNVRQRVVPTLRPWHFMVKL